MRPLTEGLLRGNTEGLTKKGWKLDEQRRCFKKADALLDYIGRIKPSEYKKETYYKKLAEQRVEGLKLCLEKDMPSKVMRGRSLEVLFKLLLIGEDLLVRAAWLYKNHPALFKAKYATSKQAFEKDAYFYFVGRHVVPETGFSPFKTGENPALSRDNTFLRKCIDMYNDPAFETPEYQAYLNAPRQGKDPYVQWTRKTKAGRRFIEERNALRYVIGQMFAVNAVELKLDKTLASIILDKKKNKLN